ncbi:fasciclin-like arabinogalactan protein, partial [Striga asiatica]
RENILSFHICVDYIGSIGSKKLHQITRGSTTTFYIFQATGEAAGTPGFVNITVIKARKVGFSHVDDAVIDGDATTQCRPMSYPSRSCHTTSLSSKLDTSSPRWSLLAVRSEPDISNGEAGVQGVLISDNASSNARPVRLIPHPHLPPQLLLSKFRLSDSKMFSPLKDDRYAGCRRTEEGFIK